MYKIDWLYVLTIISCVLLAFSVYQTAEASILKWFVGGEKVIEVVFEQPAPKTLESEIDRLSIKYNVSSSTVRAVAKCESSLYGQAVNYNRLPDGTVWSIDKGYLQINNYYHEARMNKLGWDWNNEFDSLEYGIMLMSESGLQPWSASSKCWSQLI